MKVTELRCPRCGADLDGREKQAFCEYCGAKLWIDDESKNVNYTYTKRDEARIREIESKERIRIMEMENATNEEKRTVKTTLIFVLLPVVLVALIWLGFAIGDGIATMQGHILAGNAEDYIGQNYEAVVAQLEERGFTNIATVDLNDSGLFFWNDGKVASVSIDGKTDFTDSQYFDPNAKVIITYH